MPYPELATTLVATDDDLLLAGEATVRAYCGWHIAPVRQASTRVPWHQEHAYGLLRQHRAQVLVLPTLRLLEVSSVVDNLGYELPPECYTYEPSGLLHVNTWPWQGTHWTITRDVLPSHTMWLTVTYTHGYDQVPGDVAGVVRSLAQQAKGNPAHVSMRSIGPFVTKYEADEFAAHRNVLDAYRLPPRP